MRNVLTVMVVLSWVVPVVAQSAQPGPVLQSPPPSQPLSRLQLNRPAPRQASTSLASPLPVPANTPIVSLEGVCDRSSGTASKGCKTVITRGQLDNIVDTTSPDATPFVRRQLAIKYARTLAASAVAERQHLDRDPVVAKAIQEQMKQARKQVLAAALYRKLTEQAGRVPESETRKYYSEHQADFEEAGLRRLSIPRSFVTDGGPGFDADKAKAKADELQKRALSGDDFQQLQQDAYKDLGINASLPPTRLDMVRRNQLGPEERKVLDLKPGEVSEVLELPDSFVVFKLESKRVMTIAAAQNEINTILQADRMRKELQDTAKNIKADFNLKYLEMPTAPELFPMPTPGRSVGPQGMRPDPRSRMMSGARRWPSLQKRPTVPVPSVNQPN